MKEAVIVSAVRTAVGKAPKGTLKNTRSDEMAAIAIKEAVARAGVDASLIDDVIMGCVFPEASQGMNVARTSAILAGLPVETSAMTVNRYCSSGLQTIALAAERIRTGGADAIVAGGLESMTAIPMGGNTFRPNPQLADTYPDYYLNMGLTAENLAKPTGSSATSPRWPPRCPPRPTPRRRCARSARSWARARSSPAPTAAPRSSWPTR